MRVPPTAPLMMQTGMRMLHVPYKGTAFAVPDLIGGLPRRAQ